MKNSPLTTLRHRHHWIILQWHLHLTNHQRVAVTLWIAHTFLFHRFSITPRLAATSPVKGCGKTTLLNIVKALGCRARKTDEANWELLAELAGESVDMQAWQSWARERAKDIG